MPMWAGAETTGASSKASAGIGGIAGAPEAAYPLAKTSMPDNNLPYIGALEVAERNGVEGKRLCQCHDRLNHITQGQLTDY